MMYTIPASSDSVNGVAVIIDNNYGVAWDAVYVNSAIHARGASDAINLRHTRRNTLALVAYNALEAHSRRSS